MSGFEGLVTMHFHVVVALIEIRAAGGDMPRYGELDYSERYDQWRRAQNEELERAKLFLAERGARFTNRPPHDFAVTILGIRASSTSGFAGALNNWRAAASRRVEAALDEPLDAAAPAAGGKADRPSEPVRGPVRSAAAKGGDSVRTKP